MRTLSFLISMFFASLCVQHVHAQDKSFSFKVGNTDEDTKELNISIEGLEKKRDQIEAAEKEMLKREVEQINERLDEGEITETEAAELKKQAAEKRAMNIENQLNIIDENIALLKRNKEEMEGDGSYGYYSSLKYLAVDETEREVKIDSTIQKTKSGVIMAFGLNNALIDGQSLDDSPYKIGGSRFFEIGYEFETILTESAFVRFRYGLSFQFNGLKADNNNYFVDQGDVTTLERFRVEGNAVSVDKAKLRMDNLVIPLHLEFGNTEICYQEKGSYHHKPGKFKFGVGGYLGVNLTTIQKLKYNDGENRKVKFTDDYNTSNFIYGASAYIGFSNWALYAKYDLNTLFKDNPVDQHNVSVGIRFSR